MSLLLAFCFHLFQTFTIWENECVIQHCVSECSPGYQHFYIPEIQVDDASGCITFIFISVVHIQECRNEIREKVVSLGPQIFFTLSRLP
jgi:hypothetical protein